MSTFNLPDLLGGGEVEATEEWSGCAGAQAKYQIGGITVLMPGGLLMEAVKPPLPPEPPDESIVRTDQFFWERCDGGAEQAGVGDRWWRNEDQGWEDWAGICEYGTPIRYVPAPEPVELPWGHRDREHCSVDVNESPRTWAACRVSADDSVDLTPEVAETMARALWTAAARDREATS